MGGQSTYTKNEWILLVALAAVTLGRSLCASLQAPFYPQEAEKKGATAAEYGLVFGIYELGSFFFCPIIGKYMGKLGAGIVLKSGIMIAGSSLILFGMLTFVEDRTWFISLSFLVRIIESLGTSAIVTSSYTIVVQTFSDSFARVITMIEIFHGLGYMVGPTIGGFLFEVGGFVFPFATVGGLVIVNGFIIGLILPKIDGDADKDKTKTAITTVLKKVPILLDAFSTMTQAVSIGFMSATLEPHLRQFGLSPTATGGMFAISSVTYMLVGPLVGVLCDKKWNTKKIILVGSVINIAAFMMIGPVPFTPITTKLWLVGVGLMFDGIGLAFTFSTAFVDAINSAVKYGLPDDIATYALVSGIHASVFSLGAFIGPSVAGILYDLVRFRPATLFVISLHLLLMIAFTWFLCVQERYDELNIPLVHSLDDDAVTLVHSLDDDVVPRDDADIIPETLGDTSQESCPLTSAVTSQKLRQYNSFVEERSGSTGDAATTY